MKGIIKITGSGISSKNILLSACTSNYFEFKKINLPFNNYQLEFTSKHRAIKALFLACNKLKQDKEDWQNSMGNYRRGVLLRYDAGIAEIIDERKV